jgi:dUTP pyrophosphatase
MGKQFYIHLTGGKMSLLNEGFVRVFQTHDKAKIPVRAHNTDAGMDFFFCPKESLVRKRIDPGQSVLLETGIKMEVPDDCMLQIMNKSGVASKKHLIAGACVVDEGYNGEIFVNLHNIGDTPQFIEPGQKIAQGVFIRIEKPNLKIIYKDGVYGKQTSRGDGSLGSTGDK